MIETHADDNKTIKYLFTLHLKIFLNRLGYFQSKNCMRELRATVRMAKPIIAVMDPETSVGGLTQEQVNAYTHGLRRR